MDKVKVGVVGCGNISARYLQYMRQFDILDVARCADTVIDRAQARADEFDVPCACSVEQLLDDPSIQIVVNLTTPQAHAPVALAAIASGKHVWNEKPLARTRAEGLEILEAANTANVRVGCAPDTFLGAGHQTARRIIDDSTIGRPVAATAFMLCPGHESWHPDPEFYYKPGGGPMLDMGPYYLTALIQMLGPIKRISGLATIAMPQRTVMSKPKFGQKIDVETPDHVAGAIEFVDGAIATIIMSFATHFATVGPITVFGTEGTVNVPDPNGFDGHVRSRQVGDDDWQEAQVQHVTGYDRGAGVADMAHAIRSGRPHRAGAEQALAVLDAMLGFLDSSEQGEHYELQFSCQRPQAVPANLPAGKFDD